MSRTIVGIFDNYSYSERATSLIKGNGFESSDISIITRESKNSEDNQSHTISNARPEGIHDNISDGVITGSILGGLAGLVVGIGTVIIPGLGVIAAAGPVVGLLSGAVTGGIVGGLVDLGIPEDDSISYENDIKEGKILLSMKCDDENIDEIESILHNCGATKIETY